MLKKDLGLVKSDSLICVHKDSPIGEAYEVMKTLSTRHLPVVDDENTIIGMLSDRDIKRAMEFHRWEPWTSEEKEPSFNSQDLVQEFMSWPIQHIDETLSVAEAAEMMIDKKISSLVVTQGKKAVGIVTSEDLMRVLLKGHQNSVVDLKNSVLGIIYRSSVGNIAQLLSNVGI